MVKIVVLYPPQDDQVAFEARWFDAHLPLIRKLPGVRKVEAASLKFAPDQPSPFAFQCEIYFEDAAARKEALKSPEMGACMEDLKAHVPSGALNYFSSDLRS